MAILTIARLTLREASRRKLLLAVAILTVVVAVLSGWGFHKLLSLPCGGTCTSSTHKDVAAIMLILLSFMFSFVLALGAAFIGAPSISTDVESGIVLSILPRPIRRSDLVLGKWLGLAALLALYTAFAYAMEYIIADVALGYVPPHPVTAVLFIIGEGIAVLTLTLLGSTRLSGMTCGIIVLVLFGMAWMGGIAGGVGAAFHADSIQQIGTVSSLILPTDGLWRGATYYLEPAIMIATGNSTREASANPFFVGAPPSTAYVVWAIGWIAVVLGGATWSFRRREL
jgi:ABC-type transport system involved in multi-copper enzyme maturation permease subunit